MGISQLLFDDMDINALSTLQVQVLSSLFGVELFTVKKEFDLFFVKLCFIAKLLDDHLHFV